MIGDRSLSGRLPGLGFQLRQGIERDAPYRFINFLQNFRIAKP
jgi:hypothetical protein